MTSNRWWVVAALGVAAAAVFLLTSRDREPPEIDGASGEHGARDGDPRELSRHLPVTTPEPATSGSTPPSSPPDSKRLGPDVAAWLARLDPVAAAWKAGRWGEAIATLKSERDATTDPVKRRALGDRLLVAVLEHGEPRDRLEVLSAWLAETLDASMPEPGGAAGHFWNTNVFPEDNMGGGKAGARLSRAESAIDPPVPGVFPIPIRGAWWDRLPSHVEEARSLADEATRPHLEPLLAFARILRLEMYPDDRHEMMEAVKSFLSEFGDYPDPPVSNMAAWLRARGAFRGAGGPARDRR